MLEASRVKGPMHGRFSVDEPLVPRLAQLLHLRFRVYVLRNARSWEYFH